LPDVSDVLAPLPSVDRQVGPEVRKTMRNRIEAGFFARYLSGQHVLDIGYRGGNPANLPIVPQAIGIDRDYPGYDGKTLPFSDESQDAGTPATALSTFLIRLAHWRSGFECCA
jgi:hypothetical protein